MIILYIFDYIILLIIIYIHIYIYGDSDLMWFTTADPGVLQYSHTSSVVRDNLYHKAPRAQLLVEFATTSASAIAPVQGATVLMALCAALALVIQRSSDLTRYAPETFCRNDSPKLLRWIVFDLFRDIHPSLNVAWFQRELGLGQNWAPQKIRWLSLMYQQLLGLDLDGDQDTHGTLDACDRMAA